MSLKYRDSAGTETPVAGLNGTSGELVPSVALHQTGSFAVPSLSASGYTNVEVTLQTPFPDTDYIVTFDFAHSSLIAGAIQKSTSGFQAIIGNVDPAGGTGASTCYWQAFKLMTDESRALDEAAIAQNTSDIAKVKAYTSVENVDADTLTTTGLYYLTTGCTNVPSTYCIVQVQSKNTTSSGDDIVQIATSAADNTVYTRTRLNGTWGSWQQLTSNKLTSGSGTRNSEYIGSQSSATYEINGRVCIVKLAIVFGVDATVGSVLFTGLPVCATATVNSVICNRDSAKALNVDTSSGSLTLRTAALAGEKYYGEIVYFV